MTSRYRLKFVNDRNNSGGARANWRFRIKWRWRNRRKWSSVGPVVLPMMHRAESENDKTPISASQTYPHTFYYRLKRSPTKNILYTIVSLNNSSIFFWIKVRSWALLSEFITLVKLVKLHCHSLKCFDFKGLFVPLNLELSRKTILFISLAKFSNCH